MKTAQYTDKAIAIQSIMHTLELLYADAPENMTDFSIDRLNRLNNTYNRIFFARTKSNTDES